MLKSLFHVGGKPFFSIGGQVNNSSAYDRESYCRALNAVKEMGMNTVAAPIYWEILEPCCGQYCFDLNCPGSAGGKRARPFRSSQRLFVGSRFSVFRSRP